MSLVGKLLVNKDGVVPFFAMLPGYVLPPTYFLWTLFTSGFFETSLINAITNVYFFLVIGKYLENLWGSREFLKFIGVVQFFTTFSLLFILVFLYGTTKSTIFLYGVDIHGMAGLMGGFLVVFKQLLPEQAFELGPIRIRAKDGPLIIIAVFFVLYFLGLTRFTELLCCTFGVYTAWIYLRFFQIRDGIKGDRSETFQFASFFPTRLRPLAVTLSTIVFRLLVLLSICKRIAPDPDQEQKGFQYTKPTSSLIGNEPYDAERRRNLAAAALEARLAQKPALEREREKEKEKEKDKEKDKEKTGDTSDSSVN